MFYTFLLCVVFFLGPACVCSEFVQPPPFLSLRSFTEEETQLPCEYKPQDGDTVIQVTWSVEKINGIKEQVITRHVTEGLQGAYTHTRAYTQNVKKKF